MNTSYHTTFARREIGNSGQYSAPISLGCYSMSNSYGLRSDAESIRVIQSAVDAGINLIDTADFYGWGHNEQLLAQALKTVPRDQVLISSKFGYVRTPDTAFGLCSTPTHVRQACDASLQRLGIEYLDLYFQHRLDPQVPIEDTVGAMAELVQAGKVRLLGLCEVSEATLRKAHAVHTISAVQAEYSLWTRDAESHMLKVYEELQISLMAFSPLARGMLSGQLRSLEQLEVNDVRRKYPRFSAENFPKNLALVDQLSSIAQMLGFTSSQLALAWLLNASQQVIPICGCDTLAFLKENLKSFEVQLSESSFQNIADLFAPGKVYGDRYHPAMMAMLDRST